MSFSTLKKDIHDSIHGYMEFDPLLIQIIDTPHFQRLRLLKQLGACYLVFPGASHTRFEHSLGVCHLAGQFLQQIRDKQPELGITDKDILLVQIAGLIHDLGHGPFSHLFDGTFLPALAKANPSLQIVPHEKQSILLFRHLVRHYKLPLTEQDILFISECIYHEDSTSSTTTSLVDPSKKFLLQMISNCQNSIDVDKFDYMMRDCRQLGVTSNFQADRIMRNVKVIDGELCFHEKVLINIQELFTTRHSLFSKFYYHKVSKSIEWMICDILLLSNSAMKFEERLASVESYLTLTDSILQEIELDKSNPKLEEAQILLKRIKERDLYTFVGQVTIPHEKHPPSNLSQLFEESIPKDLQKDLSLTSSNMGLRLFHLDLALGSQNPLQFIKFFSKKDPTVPHVIKSEENSFSFPNNHKDCQDVLIRLYLKTSRKSPLFDRQLSFLQTHFQWFISNNDLLQTKTESVH